MQISKSLFFPCKIFIMILIVFLIFQYSINIVKINYDIVHFIYGYASPLLFGYIPLYQLFSPKKFDYHWSLNSGIIITLSWSLYNEIIVDPQQNGIPFSHAWSNLLADILGLLFLTLTYLLLLKYSNQKSL